MSEFLKSITNIVLIAGSGQNVGKSYLGEHIIKQLCKDYQYTFTYISTNKERLGNSLGNTNGVFSYPTSDNYIYTTYFIFFSLEKR